MENSLKIFEYGEQQVRTVEKDGEAWFVAKDVCDILGLENVTKALKRLDEDELTLLRVRAGGQNREINGINESGLYALILRSDKPEAKPFRRWVTHEVLPDIIKHGMYMSDKLQSLHLASFRRKFYLPVFFLPVINGLFKNIIN